ncbi:MAG: HTH domain-containing protein [Candidatus Moraniibacteriota bacterium]
MSFQKKVKKEASAPIEKGAGYSALVQELLKRFPERSREIVLIRFGIGGEKKKTLEQIGKEYSITRERVRQVIDALLKNLRQTITQETEHPLIKKIYEVLEKEHGIVPTENLLDTLAKDSAQERGALQVLLQSLPSVKVIKETKEYRESVILSDFSMSQWKKIISLVEKLFSEKNEIHSLAELEKVLAAELSKENLTPEKLGSYLAPSFLIERNVFGRYGLSHWSAIRPRGTRERAYLVLKTLGRPLHFREIARLIDEHGLYRTGKKTHPQTVHNELIKDKRFVLVGRGTYALALWGYKRGTVREVLSDILKSGDKPMTKEELLEAVMKVRQVKKSTVIINLNTFFTKVGKNIYTLGKA